MGKRQSYASSMEVVEAGFIACWQNIRDLVAAARLLKEKGNHAPALSLSVLALEEIGKLVALDGMLLSVQGDEKSKRQKRVSRSHRDKLTSLEFFPFLLGALSRQDPRYEGDERFKIAFAIGVRNLQQAGNDVISLLEDSVGFAGLDVEKQKGFYCSLEQGNVLAPREAVKKELSDAVFRFAELADENLNFALKDGNLDRYIAVFRVLRSSLSQQEHDNLKNLAQELSKEIFGIADDI